MHKTSASWLILIATIAMDILAGMEFDLFVPSFPELQNHFNLSPFWTEALLSINFAGYCLSLFFVGSLADHFGRKPVILIGLAIFIVGSLLCVQGSSYTIIFVGRFLQGVGVAAPAILSFLIIADDYPLEKQQFLMAMLNGLRNASVAAAPIVGSFITLYFHWRGNFITLLLMGLFTALLTAIFIPTNKLPDCKEPLSLRGYIPVFQSKKLMLLTINFVVTCVVYWVFVGMSSLLYMEDLGVDLKHFGYYQGSLALVFAIGSIVLGFIIERCDHKKMLIFSSFISFVGLLSIGFITFINCRDPLWITLAIIPFIIGQVIPANILYPLSLNLIPQAKGRIAAINQAGQLIFSALGLQIVSYFYQGSFQNIGIVMMVFIVVGMITLFIIIKKFHQIKIHS